MESPTNPGGIGRLSGLSEMVTRTADRGIIGCGVAWWTVRVGEAAPDRGGVAWWPDGIVGAPADSVVATPADTATRAATGRMRAGRMPRRYRATPRSHTVSGVDLIYRAPMRARDLRVDAGAGAEFGLSSGVVGIAVGRGEGEARRLHRFAMVPEGAFVWTRDREGGYRLGQICPGDLREVESDPGAAAVGLTHVRPVRWLERVFAESEVPAAVAQTFHRGGRNFQRAHDREAERLTAELWAREG